MFSLAVSDARDLNGFPVSHKEPQFADDVRFHSRSQYRRCVAEPLRPKLKYPPASPAHPTRETIVLDAEHDRQIAHEIVQAALGDWRRDLPLVVECQPQRAYGVLVHALNSEELQKDSE